MNDLIYSVEEIFNKALELNGVHGYYIGPYQRGFKWKSKTASDQIPVLLCDLYDAYEKSQQENGQKEYYLQYLTLKKNKEVEEGKTFFEVIDGQQRLTSLIILFSVLEWDRKIEENFTKDNGNYKVKYERYLENDEKQNFDIFNEVEEKFNKLKETENEKITQKLKEITNSTEDQGLYYMVWAAWQIHNFFNLLEQEEKNDYKPFIEFIKHNVKLILNLENEFTSAEEVFASLNGNKVPLTDVYLIKGLLLTKASRVNKRTESHLHFNEIMQKRSLLAKNWDEMNNWFSLEEVKSYFFGLHAKDGLKEFLNLIKFEDSNEKETIIKKFREQLEPEKADDKYTPKYLLFNKFHDHIASGLDALKYLEKIKKLYKRFRDWYADDEVYNLLGYYLRTGGKIENIIDCNNFELRENLEKHIADILEGDVSELGYENQGKNNKLKNILLALSVFPEGNPPGFRFDFYSYAKEDWTLEHIFPQNPDSGKVDISNIDDKEWLKEKCRNKNILDDSLFKVIDNSSTIEAEKISFIYDDFKDTHSLGNMALLSQSINSSLGNSFFNTKRIGILKKINQGGFVPKHTVDVFSKMLEIKNGNETEKVNFERDLRIWNEKDVEANATWLIQRVEELKY